jgi:hypothetical protein
MVVGAAVMSRGNVERMSANSHLQYEAASSCARAAYGVLWADFLAARGNSYTSAPKVLIPDPDHPGENIELNVTHFDQSNCTGGGDAGTGDCLSQIKVRLTASDSAAPKMGPTESTNTFRSGFGGDPYRFVAHCKYPSGAEHEVEFMIRMGL